MNGSEKQIKWANDIINSKQEAFAKFEQAAKNDIARKAIAYIRNNQNAAFWIDYRDTTVTDMVRALLGGTLSIYGYNFDHTAKLDSTTGVITESWEEIVNDGKGGHKAKRTRTL